jgi:hypothetical protein
MKSGETEQLRRIAATRLPTRWGVFHAIAYERVTRNGVRHHEKAIALAMSDLTRSASLLRIHW